LSKVKFNDKSLQNLSLALKEIKSLIVLNLSRNNLTNLAGIYIAMIIEENKGLFILYFSQIELSDGSMKDESNLYKIC
jgi:hypothetical protein